MSGLDDLTREELIELVVKPYLKVKTAPQRMPSERMAGFVGELFTFVAKVQVPSENDAAERAIRPAVVARKTSGGSRSERGTKTCSLPTELSPAPLAV